MEALLRLRGRKQINYKCIILKYFTSAGKLCFYWKSAPIVIKCAEIIYFERHSDFSPKNIEKWSKMWTSTLLEILIKNVGEP